jgi:hypothetical protein
MWVAATAVETGSRDSIARQSRTRVSRFYAVVRIEAHRGCTKNRKIQRKLAVLKQRTPSKRAEAQKLLRALVIERGSRAVAQLS